MAGDAIRNRFLELCEYIKTKFDVLKVKAEQFNSEIDELTAETGGHNETEMGWHFANFRYRGTIYIERLPGESLALAMALIRAWLDEHDDLRDKYKLENPSFETITLDDQYIDLLVMCSFIDEVYLVENADGPIEWMGSNYEVSEYQLMVAETGNVNGALLEDD